jgi:hypothetical protein
VKSQGYPSAFLLPLWRTYVESIEAIHRRIIPMNGKTGIALAGLIIAIIGAFTPVVGLYIGWLALLIVTVSGFMGERGLTIATLVISLFAFLFLTPSLWIEAGANMLVSGQTGEDAGISFLRPITMIVFFAPIGAMIAGAFLKPKREPTANPASEA